MCACVCLLVCVRVMCVCVCECVCVCVCAACMATISSVSTLRFCCSFKRLLCGNTKFLMALHRYVLFVCWAMDWFQDDTSDHGEDVGTSVSQFYLSLQGCYYLFLQVMGTSNGAGSGTLPVETGCGTSRFMISFILFFFLISSFRRGAFGTNYPP